MPWLEFYSSIDFSRKKVYNLYVCKKGGVFF